MNQSSQANLPVFKMVEDKEYIFTDWFFSDRSNEITIIKRHGFTFFVTFKGGEFTTPQTIVFNHDAFDWFDYNVKVSELTLEELEEAGTELYNLYMSDDHEEIKDCVQVI